MMIRFANVAVFTGTGSRGSRLVKIAVPAVPSFGGRGISNGSLSTPAGTGLASETWGQRGWLWGPPLWRSGLVTGSTSARDRSNSPTPHKARHAARTRYRAWCQRTSSRSGSSSNPLQRAPGRWPRRVRVKGSSRRGSGLRKPSASSRQPQPSGSSTACRSHRAVDSPALRCGETIRHAVALCPAACRDKQCQAVLQHECGPTWPHRPSESPMRVT